MPRCPNCGQKTSRTQDWACPWCGYPLVSGSYREIPKTYEELKAERLQQAAVVEVEAEAVVEPEPEPVAEVEVEPEVKVEAEAVVELEPKPKAKPKPKRKSKAKPKAESKPEPELEVIVEPEPEPEAKPKPKRKPKAKPRAKSGSEVISDAMPITIDQMHLAYKMSRTAADEKFTDRILRVTGVVGRIAVDDIPDSPCVILTSPDREVSRNVLCVFDKKHVPELNQLTTGQAVTVQGKFDSCTINILITDCVLVD